MIPRHFCAFRSSFQVKSLKSSGFFFHSSKFCRSIHTESITKNDERLRLYYSDKYTVELPSQHRFPMERYKATYGHLVQSDIISNCSVVEPFPCPIYNIKLAHSQDYVSNFLYGNLNKEQEKKIGFPWSPEFVERTLLITGGTLQATDDVIRSNHICVANMAGGTHHAYRDHGEGFCIFNDLAISALYAHYHLHVARILIIDLDVHQVLLPALEQAFSEIKPDLVFYQAGVDPLTEDKLGRLSMTRNGLIDRNKLVFAMCERNSDKDSILPVVCTMGGGYSIPIHHSAVSHVDVFREALNYKQRNSNKIKDK